MVHDPGRNFLSRNFFGRVWLGKGCWKTPKRVPTVVLAVYPCKSIAKKIARQVDLQGMIWWWGTRLHHRWFVGVWWWTLYIIIYIYSILSIFWEERFGGKQMYWKINIIPGVAFHNCVLFLASVGDIAQFSRAISEIPRPPGTVSSWCFFSRICFAAVGLENGWAQLVEWATEGGHPIMPQILQKIGRTTELYLQCQRPWHLKGEQSATWNEPSLE